jgi:hypothetical protein
MTGLRYTRKKKSGETGIRTLATFARRQISNLLRYHSGTSPANTRHLAFFAVANVTFDIIICNYFLRFFLFF